MSTSTPPKGPAAIVPASSGTVVLSADALSGAQKALLFLLSLDEPVATSIIKQLTDPELRGLRIASETTKQVSPAAVHAVHREFSERAKLGVTPTLEGSTAYLKKLATRALGDGKAAAVFSDETLGPAGAVVGRLDTGTLVAILEEETAQTAAVVLSRVPATRAAEVLAHFSQERRVAVIQRLARLEAVPDDVVRRTPRSRMLANTG